VMKDTGLELSRWIIISLRMGELLTITGLLPETVEPVTIS
jgi:hypothetical protein